MSEAGGEFSILDAAADEALFKRWFKSDDTWQAWFAFLSAMFALPMSLEQFEIFRRCTGRSVAPTEPASEAWLVCGRRAGKSFVLALCAVFLACFRDWSPYLAPGEQGTVCVIAVDRKQARTILRYIRALLAVPLLAELVRREHDEGFDLSCGITIEIATASFRSVRSYTIVAALLDELAFFPTDEFSAEPDFEIINALRPGMATLPGAMLLCASSPYARRGALWDAHRKHFGKDGDPILMWKAPTTVMNPTVPERVIAEAYARDATSAAAEYGAEFRSDIEGFISRAVIDASVDRGVFEHLPRNGLRYHAFTDPSGGSSDSFTLAIAHRDGDLVLLDAIREAKPPFSPESVIADFAQLCRAYSITKVSGDRYAGEFPREQFRKHGISYEPSQQPKSDLYRDFLPLLNSRRVKLLDNARLITQLTSLERRTARSGRDSIDHAPGAHDDLANACAGALLAASTAQRQRLWQGSYGYGGPITWWDLKTGEQIDPKTKEPIRRAVFNVVRVSERVAPAVRGMSSKLGW
jgi:hypothetical protein